MPKITIREIDNTTPIMSVDDVYTVFVPGNVEEYTEENKHLFGNYTLFTSVSEFNELVGNPSYTTENPYKIIGETGTYADPGHRIAKLLLEHNLPVLYYVPELVEVPHSHTEYEVADPQPTSETTPFTGYYTRSGEEGSYTYTPSTEWAESTTYYVAVEVEDPSTYRICTYTEIVTELQDTTKVWEILKDKSLYDIRYITNGGYETISEADGTWTVATSLSNIKAVAEDRQDCIALFDFDSDISVKTLTTLADNSTTAASLKSTYVQLATPWCVYDSVTLPANVAILEAFGNQVKTSPNWFATAGFTRGVISGEPIEVIGENAANKLIHDDKISINPITKVSTSATNTAVLIWGNRTAYYDVKGLKASSFLNIRQLCCDLKKRLYRSAKQYMFEQNTDRLWFNFKSGIEEFLNNALTNEGIDGYKIYKLDPKERAQIRALVRIVPIEAVEKFDLTVELTDNLESVVTES